jgi:YesN/AraC family two-component response regulator
LAGTAVLKRKKVNRKQKATELMKDAALLAKEISEPKTPKLQLNEMLQKELWEKLLHLMDSERIYRNADLSLAELAEKLNSNTTYVSKIINDLGDSNFTTFINRYRIREACNLLTDPDSSYLSIEGIALTVGFHSKSAFNGAFKKYTGKTPSEFAGLNATGS